MTIEALSDIQFSGQSAFGGGGSASIVSVTVDFGTTARRSKTFDITVTGAFVGQQVVAVPSLDMPSGVSADELEMDPIIAFGSVISPNTVRLRVSSLRGPITRQRNINILLG